MKSDKGITIITLIIYVILLMFVIIGVSTVTTSFYTNVDEYGKESEDVISFSKFNMYFINDIKKPNLEVEDVADNYIILSYDTKAEQEIEIEQSGIEISDKNKIQVQYSMQNNSLYRDKVKICDNVDDIKFSYDSVRNAIEVHVIIGDYEKKTEYAIETFGLEAKDIEI